MRPYALERISELLKRLGEQAERARGSRDEESIHDLRVAIRRFGRSLRVFSQYVPRKPSREVRKKLRHMMELAGEARNRDIALALLRKAGIDAPAPAVASERELAARILASELERWQADREPVRWRAALELPAE
jgi:CHAD domain-containing protein